VSISTPQDPGLPAATAPRASLWLRELPFVLVLVLTIIGVAYMSFSRQPMFLYWEILAPLIGLVCVSAGWQAAGDRASRLRLILTQALHWLAFVIVMNLMLLEAVQRTFNAASVSLAIFTLLTLGTFTAGVHVFSWQVCLLGLVMALGIPAIAWIENSALLVVLVAAALAALVAVLGWYWHERRPRPEVSG